MNEYKFTLEPYRGIGNRYTCPSCGKARVFTRYIVQETGEQVADHVGRCNREVECGYHYKPKQFFADCPTAENELTVKNSLHRNAECATQSSALDIRCVAKEKSANPSFISEEYLKLSLKHELQEANNFLKYLKTITNDWQRCATMYCVGSAQRWKGSTTFWYIDKRGLIRSGKVILYDATTGKRVKKPYPHITWVHSELLKKKLINEFELSQCLYGEHLLINEPRKPIGIVESEKTAIIASAYLPELTWMATGSLSGLNAQRLSAIAQNPIVLYPDIKGFEKWDRKADELRRIGFRITVSDLLEKSPFVTEAERANGFDLGDYLPRCTAPVSQLTKLIERNPNIATLVKQLVLTEL